MKRKSRLIRCTRWALHSAPSPPSVSVFQSQTRHASLFSSWKRGKAEWEKRSESRVQVLGLQTIPSINHTQCVAPHHEHWVFARTNQAFRPQVLRVPACTMRAGLASKSKFVLIKKKKRKKKALFLLVNCIQIVFLYFRKKKSPMSCLLFLCMAHYKVNSTGISCVSTTPKPPALAWGRDEAQGRIVFSGRRGDRILFRSLRFSFKGQQLPSRLKSRPCSFL